VAVAELEVRDGQRLIDRRVDGHGEDHRGTRLSSLGRG
jgi:hypothetical protein